MATATEEGVVSFINGSEDSQFDLDKGRESLQIHQNAIFDLAWSQDDRFIVRSDVFLELVARTNVDSIVYRLLHLETSAQE